MKSIFKKLKLIILNMGLFIIMLYTKVFAGIDLNIKEFETSNGAQNASKLVSKAGIILGILQAIGSVVSVVMLIMIGIKYMLGSVEEKAEYKETLKPYIIGCVLLFIIPNLVQIIFKFSIGLG